MKNNSDPSILVVGAGPIGLATALLLHSLGYAVSGIAPARDGPDERTSALLAGSVNLLEKIGAWTGLGRLATPLCTLRIVDGTKRLIRAPEVTFHASEIDLDAFGYNVPNTALLAALEEARTARGINWRTATVDAVRPAPDRLTLVLSTGEEVSAPLVVAADGRRSTIREGVGIAVSEWRYDQVALVVNVSHARPHDDTSTEFHTETGPFTLVPLPGNRSSLVWVDTPAESARRVKLDEASLAAEIEARSASILGKIAIDGKRQTFPLSGMNARRFAGDRAVLVGEAAHVFPPIGAQGLNLGYRDVTALGAILDNRPADPGSPDRLAAYDRARRADVATRTTAVDALNRSLLTDFLPVQAVRGLGLFLLDRIPALREAVMRRGVAEVS